MFSDFKHQHHSGNMEHYITVNCMTVLKGRFNKDGARYFALGDAG
jgi:hypothetical protein